MKEILCLYRDIRRLHRLLPPEFKYIGDQYLRSEFRLHRKANAEFVKEFSISWQKYKTDLQSQLVNKQKFGSQLDTESLDKLTPAQLGQLLELKKSVKKIK
jgi:hypothetical protein